jgi:hypothetical protein
MTPSKQQIDSEELVDRDKISFLPKRLPRFHWLDQPFWRRLPYGLRFRYSQNRSCAACAGSTVVKRYCDRHSATCRRSDAVSRTLGFDIHPLF